MKYEDKYKLNNIEVGDLIQLSGLALDRNNPEYKITGYADLAGRYGDYLKLGECALVLDAYHYDMGLRRRTSQKDPNHVTFMTPRGNVMTFLHSFLRPRVTVL